MLSSLLHPFEIPSMLKLKYSSFSTPQPKQHLSELAKTVDSQTFCNLALAKVSRSFAAVILSLPDQLQTSICVFYLVLRALDSIEDDMNFPFSDKIPLLRTFYTKLSLKNWTIENVGDSDDYRSLLANFTHVLNVYHSLTSDQKEIITDITKRMGEGMADFMERYSSNTLRNESAVESIEDYDLYCHYVAGLVGEGLSNLFSSSKLESSQIASKTGLSNSMGLFLQKTNIIRDYAEDLQSGRTWWPKQIWGRFASNLTDFREIPRSDLARNCLNCMLNNALKHTKDVLEYLSLLTNQKVFEFCAVPQVMAIATLALCYNNPAVFVKNVKIRKSLACWLMLNSSSMSQIKKHFRRFALEIRGKIPSAEHPINLETKRLINQILEITDDVKLTRPQLFLATAWNVATIGFLLSTTSHFFFSAFSIQSPFSPLFKSFKSSFEQSATSTQWLGHLVTIVKRSFGSDNIHSIVAAIWIVMLVYFASSMKSKFV